MEWYALVWRTLVAILIGINFCIIITYKRGGICVCMSWMLIIIVIMLGKGGFMRSKMIEDKSWNDYDHEND